ncbi:Reducing polyketide synthase FUB1 [Clarias magur]|uniref:Reducing polyketide synthase FUB1 n=1 Tax=Clarias magur TaxID=1594786 RepID=A0A8J4UB51_CLAMG|nr:Reducing polyketide synthase FUB1 [Clarias magur]
MELFSFQNSQLPFPRATIAIAQMEFLEGRASREKNSFDLFPTDLSWFVCTSVLL